ncbi:MAG: Bug family tripartite tricarboxylate transporter substrate binding protein [Pseudomonadota bacterium]
MRTMFGVAAAMLVTGSMTAAASDYPNQPIRLVIPYAAGGVSDVASRLIGERLAEEMGQPVVPENRSGAAGTVAANWVAAQPGDGYTIYAAPVSLALNHILQDEVGYDLDEDFTIISGWIDSPFILHAHPSLGVATMDDLLAKVRAEPDTYTIGTSGIGAVNHLSAEYWIAETGVDVAVVHYQGGAPARQDLLAGVIDMMFAAANEAVPIIEAERTVGIAVTTRERLDDLPDLPTVEEALGLDEFEAIFWLALVVPSSTPDDIVGRLREAMAVVGDDAELRQEMIDRAITLNVLPADEVERRFQRATEVFGPMLERAAQGG